MGDPTNHPEEYVKRGLLSVLAELHADLFSRHTSPLEVCVFVAVYDRGKDVMSDEICRRCDGKQQRRRRVGGSVLLPDWLMIPPSRHLGVYTYVLSMTKYIRRETNTPGSQISG